MDDDDASREQRRRDKERRRSPQHKYKDMLQDLADRKIIEFVIDLDDLQSVRLPPPTQSGICALTLSLTSE